MPAKSRSLCSSTSRRLRSGDVDPPRDDPDDVAVLVDQRGRLPGDHALLPVGVGEDVLVLRPREVRGRVPEALDHRRPLGGVDEDVPEVPPLDSGAVVEPARDLDRAVEVRDPAIGVDHREEAGGGVEDGLEEAVLRAELGLQALLLEGERGRRRHGVHELALVGEAPVMEERCDALAAVLDERRSVPGPRDRLGERLALVVDPRLTLRGPVGQVQRRVAERRRQRVAERAAVAEGDHEVRRCLRGRVASAGCRRGTRPA